MLLSDEQVEELAYQALLVIGRGADYWEIQRAVEGAIREAVLIVADAVPCAGGSGEKRREEMMFEGQISIYRPRGGDQDYIEIELVDLSSATTEVMFDLSSRVHFLKVQINHGDFTKALTGGSFIPCRFLLRPAHVGEVYEHKVVEVSVPDCDFADREAVAHEAVRAREEDGWVGRVEDALNHHNFAGRAGDEARYRVTFVRYVKKEDNDDVE